MLSVPEASIRLRGAASPAAGLSGPVHSVQFLRFVAAMAVVFYHSYEGVGFRAPGLAGETTQYLFRLGASGVHIFFCISGFVMVYTAFGDGRRSFSAARFLGRRLIRIYPIYWIIAAAYVAFHSLNGTPYALSAGALAGAFALLPSDSSTIIGPAWTLSFEMYFYLTFAVFMAAGLVRGLWALSAFFVALVAIGVLAGGLSPHFGYFSNPLLFEFLGGAWLGYLAVRRRALTAALGRVGPLVALAGIAGFAAGLVVGYDRFPSLIAWGGPSLLLLAGALWWEASGRLPGAIVRLAWLGDFSYVLYLVHTLLIDIALGSPLREALVSPAAAVLVALLISGASCLVALALYRWLERPMLRALKRLFGTRRSPA